MPKPGKLKDVDGRWLLAQRETGLPDDAIARSLGVTRKAIAYRMKQLGATPRRQPTAEQRFWRFVEKTNTCWEWKVAKNLGYGQFPLNNKQVRAHRFAYELLVGTIPKGLVIDHLCRNRGCVNPAHLEPVTVHENMVRGEGPAAENERKTHCKRGHALTPGNFYVVNGARICSACAREQARRDYHRRRRNANQTGRL